MDSDSSLDRVFFPDSGVVLAVAVYADGISLRWLRSVGRVARLCKLFLGAESSSIGLSSSSPSSRQRCRGGVHRAMSCVVRNSSKLVAAQKSGHLLNDRGSRTVTLRLQGRIFGNAPNKPPRGWPRVRRYSTIARKVHRGQKVGHEPAMSAISF